MADDEEEEGGNLERDLDKVLAVSTVKYQDSDEVRESCCKSILTGFGQTKGICVKLCCPQFFLLSMDVFCHIIFNQHLNVLERVTIILVT